MKSLTLYLGSKKMSSLSRKYARISKRGNKLMEQYQPVGAYKEAEQRYNEERDERRLQKLNSNPEVSSG
jgi:hypothetical protein